MLDDLPWFYDPYIFHLTSRTLSLFRFDQIYQFVVSSLSHIDFDQEGAIPIKLQSLVQLYQSYQLLHLRQPCLRFLPWTCQLPNYRGVDLVFLNHLIFVLTCSCLSLTLGCFAIPNRSHTSTAFFDCMCSHKDHTLVKEGKYMCPKMFS